MEVLFQVCEVLRSCAVECDVPCPGYIEFPNHAFMYTPDSRGAWLHMHETKTRWTHLITDNDPRVVAKTIHAHLSATKKSV
jgi:hypothetical protein